MRTDKLINSGRCYMAPNVKVFAVALETLVCVSTFAVAAVREGENDWWTNVEEEY